MEEDILAVDDSEASLEVADDSEPGPGPDESIVDGQGPGGFGGSPRGESFEVISDDDVFDDDPDPGQPLDDDDSAESEDEDSGKFSTAVVDTRKPGAAPAARRTLDEKLKQLKRGGS